MENKTITLEDGRKLGYAEYGDPKGKPVLLYHGTPSSRINPNATLIDSVSRTLGKDTIRLFSLDRPGYGLSDSKEGRTINEWSSDIEEFLDQLEIDTFSLYAISGGGPYAISSSYYLGDRINKVAVVCGLGPVYLPEIYEKLSPEGKASVDYPEALGSFTDTVQSNPKAFVENLISGMNESERSRIPAQVIEEYTRSLSESTKRPDGMISDYQAFGAEWNVPIEKISVPIHFWHSEDDQSVPFTHSEFLVSKITGAKLTKLTGLNHYTTVLGTIEYVLDYILRD
jgi:pimeloyl-ACP methyl ester carboxylesterase